MRAIKLTKRWSYWLRNHLAVVCEQKFREHVELPMGVCTIYLVFTKHPKADSFQIGFTESTGRIFVADLPRTELYTGLEGFLREAWGEGLRYFHFEY